MKIELQPEGHWLATGRGPIRYIAVEADTRREAMRAYAGAYMAQGQKITDQDYMPVPL